MIALAATQLHHSHPIRQNVRNRLVALLNTLLECDIWDMVFSAGKEMAEDQLLMLLSHGSVTPLGAPSCRPDAAP
jgi:hypothetical protein